MVIRCRAETLQSPCRLRRRRYRGRIGRVAQYADKAIYRERTGCPTILAVPPEPPVSGFVILMSGIKECDQDVHIQQSNAQASSRSLFTIRRLDLAVLDFATKRVAPFRTFKGSRPARDCLASSEITLPSVTPRSRANSLAEVRRSSSSSKVVRISYILLHHTSRLLMHRILNAGGWRLSSSQTGPRDLTSILAVSPARASHCSTGRFLQVTPRGIRRDDFCLPQDGSECSLAIEFNTEPLQLSRNDDGIVPPFVGRCQLWYAVALGPGLYQSLRNVARDFQRLSNRSTLRDKPLKFIRCGEKLPPV